ncbi:hypothetical protein [Stenotrophomonas maltophilia]|uniref:hypothetical protein n=1 Tax=Stenotrophomonas maltophilia TaxID=40324 RepID=UPI000DA29734|nr:hypothetical protein [Stenotrophomonas maltophilia]MBN4998573.1 hypothetical protein [Stenotrophomonas maltophilia]MBN5007414.1 hypothetical protein [Stenotrophomonas maltophilia]MCU1085532.1 hypothetical protein [Stenotrophomonas maltophilia]MCU1161790.1 hypothetical protein [Stenotrophomonas maltophilia]TIL17703.1 hypothetical protein E4419_00520 [Stenotrophomonas maltophilia]
MNNSPQNQNDRPNSDGEKKQSGQQGQVDGNELGGEDLAGKQGQQQQQPGSKEREQSTHGQEQKGSAGRDSRR